MIPLYAVATFSLATSAVGVVGSLSGLIARRHAQSFWPWFGFGAACVAIATQLPQQPQLVLLLTPVAAAVMAPDLAGEDRWDHNAQLRSWWWIRFLVVALVGVMACSCSVITMATLKRSASASATIVRTQTIEWSVSPQGGRMTYGKEIAYKFSVGAVTYESSAARQWNPDEITAAHVCYDPGDPGGSHALEPAGFPCGNPTFENSDR